MQDLTLYQDRHKKILSLDFEFSKNYDEMWMYNYNKVKSFIENNLKNPSQHSKNKEEKISGIWIATQKNEKRENQLTPERIFLLEKLPNWVWDTDYSEMWKDNYNKTKSFIKNNLKNPSHDSKNKEEKRLNNFISTQKSEKRKNKLTPEKINLLKKLPGWVWDTDYNEMWKYNYNKTKIFIKNNKKNPSQHSKDKEEKILGKWVEKQKKARRKEKLTQEKIKLLEKLPNWKWDFEEVWMGNYEKIKSFIEENNEKYPSEHSKNKKEKRFGQWINSQKRAKRGTGTGKLTPERISLLEKLPGWVWTGKSNHI